MGDVRNHNTRAFPFGALLTKVFNHFDVNVRGQINQGIRKFFSMNTIKKGISFSEEEREENVRDDGISRQCMEEDEILEVLPHVDPNFELPQLQWRDKENIYAKEPIHVEIPMEEEHLMHGAYPSQEGTSSQGGPPA